VLKVRKTKTGSGNTAVQVVSYHGRRIKVVKHVGTAHNAQEIADLVVLANQFVLASSPTPPLFPEVFDADPPRQPLVSIDQLVFTKTYHTFAYEFLARFYRLNGFAVLNSALLQDLAFMRIIEPASKLRSVELFNKYFGGSYTRNIVYKGLPALRLLKPEAERAAVLFAKKNLGFDFAVVFYDVTTLYFETFQDDELRQAGYSKDNKSNQPQVIIALVVTPQGYPVAADLFAGNTFEGHTLLPVIQRLRKAHTIDALTVVADAAMLSLENLAAIKAAGLTYIVGARLGSLPSNLLRGISTQLQQTEGQYVSRATPHGRLICDYSKRRATKDRSDRTKQIQKARDQIEHPTQIKRRSRFIREKTKATFELNHELIEADELREGLKGYYTNLENLPDELIVARYKDLWNVEKSFRMAKTDLAARPIYHHKRESIETHILVVFVGLCLAKSIELATGLSIKKVRDLIWDVLDIEFVDRLTNKQYRKRMDVSQNQMASLMKEPKRAY
jgi:hypothetical protein